jgi:hypothetical protein
MNLANNNNSHNKADDDDDDDDKCDKEAKSVLKYKDLSIDIQRMWKVKKYDTSNNRGNWNDLKIIPKISEQHTSKARSEKTAEHSHIGHCIYSVESINVKLQ